MRPQIVVHHYRADALPAAPIVALSFLSKYKPIRRLTGQDLQSHNPFTAGRTKKVIE